MKHMSVRTGRPRDTGLDASLLEATADLLAEGGSAAVTIDAVVRRAGTTRPAFYRRYRNRSELIVATLAHRFGTDPAPDTGSLRGDLEAAQRNQLRLYTDPVFVGGMPGLLAELPADAELAGLFSQRFLNPRRVATGRILERAAARGEIAPYEDYDWICDLMTGPLLKRLAVPSLPLDERLIELTVDAALAVLGAPRSPTPREPAG
jgi:AcrR family transcriptional regulator